MIKATLLFVLVLITQITSAQYNSQNSDLKNLQLNGKVSTLRTYVGIIDTLVEFDEKTSTFYTDKHVVFNELGQITERYNYNHQTNKAEEKELNFFDSIHQKIKTERKKLGKDGSEIDVIIYTYNDDGTLKSSLSENRFSTTKTIYYYDERKNLIRTIGSTPIGNIEVNWKYDKNNLVIEENMPEDYIIKNKYDSINRLIEKTIEYVDKRKDKIVYKYDQFGNDIENQLYLIDIDKVEEYLIYIEYIYDNNNNWILRKKTMNGKIMDIEKRSISYF